MTTHTVRASSPHRDLAVRYAGMNARTRGQVAAVLEPLLWIVPPWCRSLHLRLDDCGDGNMATCVIDDEYRQASIRLDPDWLAQGEEDQRRYLGHELVHILLEPMGSFGRRLLDGLGDTLDKAAFDLLDAEWVRAVEMVTNDIDRTLAMIDDQAVDVRRVR